MTKKELTQSDKMLLEHLKREVDHYQEKLIKGGFPAHENIKSDLIRARSELKEFVADLRFMGTNI